MVTAPYRFLQVDLSSYTLAPAVLLSTHTSALAVLLHLLPLVRRYNNVTHRIVDLLNPKNGVSLRKDQQYQSHAFCRRSMRCMSGE